VPIRWRLTVFNALVMGAILTAFGVSVFFLVRGALLSGVEHAVRDRAEGVARTVETGQSLSAGDVERLTLEGVFVIVRDGEGRILARTVGSAADAGEPFWRRAIQSGEPVGGQVSVSPDERGYVYAVPVEPPELESIARSPYFYKALTAPSDRGSPPIFGEAERIPFPGEARVVEVGKSYESAGATVATFATLLAIAISAAFLVTAGGAYLLARAALSPVEAVVVSARGIGAGDLSKRLPVGRPKDEVGRLTATINDLLSHLEAAFARREEALVSQRRFVADASHQLRTPLTSIEGYARMLRAWGLDDPETAREGAEAIHRESRHMRKLVEDLLALARGDERAPLRLGLHDLDALAAAAVAAADVAAGGRPSVRHVLAEGPVRARFDRERVEQAVAILLDNAVKYTAEWGKVAVSTARRDGGVVLEVSDTGKGIPEEDLPYVFERFYRAEETRAARGAGLGLSIARQIAEAHGGSLSVESEAGAGSTFTLLLPRNGPSRD
jgi:two-component system, OmpR family, sensor kinase